MSATCGHDCCTNTFSLHTADDHWLDPDDCPQCSRCRAPEVDFLDWCARVVGWHRQAFPNESLHEIGLMLGEEIGELQRTILKEGHGANDRRADVDWKAERQTEFADVMIALVVLAERDGFDIMEALDQRLRFVAARFSGADR